MIGGAAGRAGVVIRGLAALAVLGAVVGGLPVLLYRLGGAPVPARLPSWHRVIAALLHRDSGGLFLGAVRDVSWLGWAIFTLAVLTEAQAAARGRRAPRLRLAGAQAVASRLVASAALLFSAPAAAALAASPAIVAGARAPAPAAAPSPSRAAPSPGAGPGGAGTAFTEVSFVETGHARRAADRTVVVRPGDCLWTLAERYLGAGDLYPEIVRLNLGRDMGHGEVFRDPSQIQPGWRLLLPPAPAHPHGPPGRHDEDRHGGRDHDRDASGAAGGHGRHSGHPSREPRFRHSHAAAGSPPPGGGTPVAGPSPGTAPPAPSPGPSASPAMPVPGTVPPGGAGAVLITAERDQVPEFALFSLGMLAGGALVSLDRLRHRQRQHRRTGRRIALPSGEASRRVERKLRASLARLAPFGLGPGAAGGGSGRRGTAAARYAATSGGAFAEPGEDWPGADGAGDDLDAADDGAAAGGIRAGAARPGPQPRHREPAPTGEGQGARAPATMPDALRELADGLAAAGDPLPPIVGLHLTPGTLEVLLSAPSATPPPPPFTIAPGRQAMCWTVRLGDDRAGPGTAGPPAPGEVGDVLPGLFTAGATDSGGYLLLDLEALRVTCCDGPGDLADRLLVTAATELASSRWSGWYDLILVGCDELEILGRAETCPDLDEALDLLQSRAATVGERLRDGGPADVRARRLSDPEDEDWGLTLLVSRAEPTPAQMARLLALADGPGGIAALVAGDTQAEGGKLAPALMRLGPDPDRDGEMMAEISMAHLGPDRQITVWPQTLTVAEYEALAGVFATAAVTEDVSPAAAPYQDYGGPPWARFAAAPVAPAGEWPAVPADEEPADEHEAASRPGGPAHGALRARDASRAGPGPGGGAGEREPEDRGQARDLAVRVLGPVEVTGPAEPLQPKQAELVLALALHAPVGLSGSALCALLGPDEDHPRPADAVRQLITRTRRRLGRARDGRECVIHLGSGVYVLHEDVRLDWTEFSALAARGRARRDPADLRAAMALVRGEPFAGCYHWWLDVGLVETIRAEIVDTAELLAAVELNAGNPGAAARAARAGLAAEPAAEQLWRALMRSEHEAGNADAVARAWRGCLDAISEIAPGAEPHPDTERLYRQLSGHPGGPAGRPLRPGPAPAGVR